MRFAGRGKARHEQLRRGPIVRGTITFVVLMTLAAVILSVFPGIALWLPEFRLRLTLALADSGMHQI